jgi:hypothetical protein
MLVETYECEELKNSEATTMAVDAEAVALIESLNLEGQKALTNTETLTREPYREMTRLEYFVWSSVCPERTSVSVYRLSPIPLRVLQVIAYAQSLGIYHKLEVWHPRQVKEDPILVGVARGEEWSSKCHLLARWGDVLVPFAELQERSKGVFKRKLASLLAEAKADIARTEERLDARVQLAFDEEKFDMPTFYNIATP